MPSGRPGQSPPKVHYLPGNKITWSPPTVIYLKALTRTIPGSDPEALELSGWVARIVKRRDVKPGSWSERTAEGTGKKSLGEWIIEHTKGRETTWIFTHNAALDLITTELPLVLHRAGFDVTEASLSGSAPWIRLVRGSRRICVVDSFSWLPHTVAELADRIGAAEPKRNRGETDDAWAVRSGTHDLGVVSQCMQTLLGWWDEHALGKWSISGPATGWHAMRHLPSPQRCVIDPDPVRIAADRQAIYGGRRGAWIVGSRSLGPFLELDFANAYPSVAADLPLPARRTVAFDHMDIANWRLTSDRWGIIADVSLRTTVPRWPVRFPGGTFCPTGTFRTTLAGPEIRDALRLGCLDSVGPGITHQLNYHLKPWADWTISTLRNHPGNVPAAAQLWAKHMSRTVVGKWAARAYERTDLGNHPNLGWGYTEIWDHNSGARGSLVTLAGEQWSSTVSGDAEQAYPAVLAWIESEVRVRLTRVIEALGERAVIQCDTDGLIVTERLLGTDAAGGHLRAPTGLAGAARTKWVLDQLDPIIAPLTIRIKKTHKSVRVLGPQHVKTPSGRKYSGIPKLAKEIQPDVFLVKQWPGLSSQLGFSQPGHYLRPETTVRINGPYAPGWVLSDGRVVPPECTITDTGENRLLGWEHMTTRPTGAKLAESQHPALAALW